jgi:outer membrane autotransporter protein
MKHQESLTFPMVALGASAGLFFGATSAIAQPAGCPTGVFTTGNQTIVCSIDASVSAPQTSTVPIGTYSTSTPAPAGSPALTSNAYDGINLTITQYTTITTPASPIGLASGSSVSNSGTLSSNFLNGYGISFGVNGRSQNGGNSVINTATGSINTLQTNSDGIRISASKATSLGNTATNDGVITTKANGSVGISVSSGATGASIANSITNNGSISTQGQNAYGIELSSKSGINTIANGTNGKITSSGAAAHGLNVQNTNQTTITNAGNISVTGSAANAITINNGTAIITNSGTLNAASGLSVQFSGTVASGTGNTLILQKGSALNSGIAFNANSTQETLTFDGYSNAAFNNAVTGVNLLNAQSGANVVMNHAAGYEFLGGQLSVDGTSALTIAAPILGASSLTKIGDGTLTLAAANLYSGGTTVESGTLDLTGSVASDVTVLSASTLSGGGIINGNFNNSGLVSPSLYTNQATTLTVNGNYVGNNGLFDSNLFGTPSQVSADRLLIAGAGNTASGTTQIHVIDHGILGLPTSGNGIQLVGVEAGANSASNAFALSGRVAAGAMEYSLYQGSSTDSTDKSFYLRTAETQIPTADTSAISTPAPTPTPVAPSPAVQAPVTPGKGQRIEVAVYPALPSLVQLYAQTVVDTLDQRRGDLMLDAQNGDTQNHAAWARLITKSGTSTPETIEQGPKLDFDVSALQFGADLYKKTASDGAKSYIGTYATIGKGNGDTSNQAGTVSTGSLHDFQAYSVGIYATNFAANGWYVDALAQGTRYLDVGATSVYGASIQTQGTGWTGSLEVGQRWLVSDKILVVPQAQLVYETVRMNDAIDDYGIIQFNKNNTGRARLGLLTQYKDDTQSTPFSGAFRVNYWHTLNESNQTTFSSLYGVNPVSFDSTTPTDWLELDASLTVKLTQSTQLFVNVGWEDAPASTYRAYSGRIGIQSAF